LNSPYNGLPAEKWLGVTRELIEKHPLKMDFLADAVLVAWDEILSSSIGEARIGVDILPQPQIVGFFLHELIPIVISRRVDGWRRGSVGAQEKDLHCIDEPAFSIEIKTSSNARHIFGNRSYAQQATGRSREKAGYYLAVNFMGFGRADQIPRVLRIRFGWLDHSDWIGQTAAIGQQARLTTSADSYKLQDILDQATRNKP
jgi:hypothetical protein